MGPARGEKPRRERGIVLGGVRCGDGEGGGAARGAYSWSRAWHKRLGTLLGTPWFIESEHAVGPV